MALAQTATTPPAGNGALRPSDGKALSVEILKGIIWWISSVLVWKSPDIHVAAISDKDDPDICSLQGQPGVLYYVVSDRLIDSIDAFVAGSPRDVVTA
jgi:hypothetical protein